MIFQVKLIQKNEQKSSYNGDDVFFFVVWSINERRLALFLVETIVRDLQQCEYPTRREQDLNVRKT